MSERGGSGFSSGSGGHGGASLDQLLRRIKALEDNARADRPDGLVVAIATTGTPGVYVGRRLEGRADFGTSSIYYNLPLSSGTHYIQNIWQNGTWGTQIPLLLPLLASRRPGTNNGGEDLFLVQYAQPGGTNGIGGGGAPGGDGDGGGAGGGGGGGGGSPPNTLKLLYYSSFDCEPAVMAWGAPVGPVASDCSAPGGPTSGGDSTDVWFDNGDSLHQQYWQDTGLLCTASSDDFPPPPDPPISTPACP